jgi:hypothetical protein
MSHKHIHREEKVGNFIIRIVDDLYPHNPRENDNITKMVCFHRRYNLGDKHGYNQSDYKSWDELKKAIIKAEKPVMIKPLYLYDHSGITIATSPFGCQWDSGQIGWVYITAKTMKDFWSKDAQRDETKMNEAIEVEVQEYDKYLTGEAYAYEIYRLVLDVEGDIHEKLHDSCAGFNDEDDAYKEALAIVEFENVIN